MNLDERADMMIEIYEKVLERDIAETHGFVPWWEQYGDIDMKELFSHFDSLDQYHEWVQEAIQQGENEEKERKWKEKAGNVKPAQRTPQKKKK